MLPLSRTPIKLIPDSARYCLRLRRFSSSPPTLSLAGSVARHDAYVLLHTHAPPSEYPARSKSPLWRQLTLRARAWGGLVNFAWSPALPVHAGYSGLGEPRGNGHGNGNGDEKGMTESEEPAGAGEEAYVASVFAASRRGRLHLPLVSLANLDAVDAQIRAHVLARHDHHHPDDPSLSRTRIRSGEPGPGLELDGRLFLYVCTHGARDCRCGETGGEVARALRTEVAKRGVGDEVCVGEVAHVGGHKYAANVLVFPYGDWLGTVQEVDVPRVLDEVLAWHGVHRRRRSQPARSLPPLCPPYWRGRMGLDKDEQLALASQIF
ncbi:Sucrase/ferredoxin-like-domain-containing protein [Earliella scabrosa]|nr:Sucrase/ferredoxin-like-domain-containing protein [Earliella scabrosa]